ncbi:hypothetical protein [Helicobacter enhydrae]|uniref:hypothetical protein n=1 Tax=Helicobacter enhydrae TaxID=222136 RepID=UPI001900D018|nr:hypothetical protein [Helicobacter enhydrae]
MRRWGDETRHCAAHCPLTTSPPSPQTQTNKFIEEFGFYNREHCEVYGYDESIKEFGLSCVIGLTRSYATDNPLTQAQDIKGSEKDCQKFSYTL